MYANPLIPRVRHTYLSGVGYVFSHFSLLPSHMPRQICTKFAPNTHHHL